MNANKTHRESFTLQPSLNAALSSFPASFSMYIRSSWFLLIFLKYHPSPLQSNPWTLLIKHWNIYKTLRYFLFYTQLTIILLSSIPAAFPTFIRWCWFLLVFFTIYLSPPMFNLLCSPSINFPAALSSPTATFCSSDLSYILQDPSLNVSIPL